MAGLEQSEQPQKQKRWRFSLRTLLLLTTLVALVIGLNVWLLLPFAVLVFGLGGNGWVIFLLFWPLSLYLVHKDRLASTDSQTVGAVHRSPLNLAKWGCLLITSGCTRAFVAAWFLYEPNRTQEFPDLDRYWDLIALYLYLVGFLILMVWVPRRRWLRSLEISHGWRIVMAWLFRLMIVLGPIVALFAYLTFFCGQLFLQDASPNFQLAVVMIWATILSVILHGAAGVLLVIYLSIGLVFDHFPTRKTTFLLVYCGLAWAFILTGF